MTARPRRGSPSKRPAAAPAVRNTFVLPAWLPALLAAAGGLALLWFQLTGHRTPLYGVETDLLGDLIPAARALRAGHIDAANFEFKGPGYPMLLAAAGGLLRDDWLAARVLNVIAAAIGAWFAGRIATRFLGAAAGLFVLCGLFLNPVWMLAAVEAGTDMPAFALSMAATDVVLRARRPIAWGAAGLLAAAAILTRYNAVALVPAALVTWLALRGTPRDAKTGAALGPGGTAPEVVAAAPRAPAWLANALPYLAGLALPLLAWAIVGQVATGGALRNRNYLNVAFEIYGRGGTWDAFWLDAGERFHSMADVLLLDPVRVVKVLGRSAVLRWWDDVRQLVPVWIGVPALLGMLWVWPRRIGAPAVAAHFVFAYLVLTTVFYNPRFFLYLIPFYLLGAAALVFAAPPLGPGARRAAPVIPFVVRIAAAAILLVVSGGELRTEARARLAEEPFEVRAAAETLRRIAPQGGRIMARKPHVAYFAGMELVPLPQVDTFLDLFAAARETRADYLFYSGLEAHLRDQFWLLDVPGIALPGLERVEERTLTPYRYYTLYRFTSAISDSAALVDTLLRQVSDLARANPDDARAQSQVGGMLLRMGRPAEALPALNAAALRAPGNLRLMLWRASACFETGDYEAAARHCELLGAASEPPAGTDRLMGMIRLAQERPAEARAAWKRATRREPLSPERWFEYAAVEQAFGDAPVARAALDRCAALDPAKSDARRRALATIPPGSKPGQVLAVIRSAAP